MIRKSTIASTTFLIAGGLIGLAPSIAIGDEHSAFNIADNDGVYIDGKAFQVIPGKAKGDAMAQIRSLGARDLGPAAIIFRAGGRLYIADTQSQAAAHTLINFAYDPQGYTPSVLGGGSYGYNNNVATNYAYDPRAVNPALSGGGSAGYNQNAATNYAYDPRAYPIRNPDPWANNYAYDPRVPVAQPSIIYDADYVEYRLKKAFEDNWTPMGTPTATK